MRAYLTGAKKPTPMLGRKDINATKTSRNTNGKREALTQGAPGEEEMSMTEAAGSAENIRTRDTLRQQRIQTQRDVRELHEQMNKMSVTVGEGEYTSTLLPAVARAVIQIEARTSKVEYCMYTNISIRDTHVLFKEIEDGAKMYTEEVDKMKKAG